MKRLRPLIVAVLLIPLTFGPMLLAAPHTAKAVVPTIESMGPLLFGVQTSAINQTTQTTILEMLNGIAWEAANAVIQGMTKSTVTWINSGFEGSPAFEQNLTLSLRNAGDVLVMRSLRALSNSEAVQSPFLEKILTGAGAAYYLSSSEDRLEQRLRYTLNQKVANDRAFLAGDFKQGGFDGWFSVWMNPANNPISAEFLLGQELGRQLEGQAFQQVQELQWGRGYMSWRGDCLLKAPNTTTGTDAVSLAEDNCLQYDIQTPGSLFADALPKAIQAPAERLMVADSINEIISALMAQMVTQVIGSTGLLGSSQPTQGGGRSPLDIATDPNNNPSGGIKKTIEDAIRDTTTYKTGWEKILGAAKSAQVACALDAEELAEATALANVAASSVEKANIALPQLNALLQTLAGTPTQAQLAAASNQFISIMSSGNVPTSAEAQNAQAQSASTGDTLYTQMIALQNECQ